MTTLHRRADADEFFHAWSVAHFIGQVAVGKPEEKKGPRKRASLLISFQRPQDMWPVRLDGALSAVAESRQDKLIQMLTAWAGRAASSGMRILAKASSAPLHSVFWCYC